ncbi:MAG: nucleotidyltransferase family protein [Thaumarchaeota archaeon]|nr:nucleotidyltransferase family protein [Candidatus Calditenuaceae archaeon]MDW8186735.1 nucleotidyltransferase family protein [Nitrososphaerota archaeon]
MRFAAIVLGAGASIRMRGGFKLVEEVGGKEVVRRVVEAALGSECSPVVVVLGYMAERVRSVLPKGVEVVLNSDWSSGMSSSIRKGVEAVMARAEGVIICPGDMPFVRSETLNKLVKACGEGIAYCAVAGEVRSPVAFSSRYFKDLMALEGDEGAKRVVMRHIGSAVAVEVDPLELMDVDSPEELELARSLVNRLKL